jgi:hypothetical protein
VAGPLQASSFHSSANPMQIGESAAHHFQLGRWSKRLRPRASLRSLPERSKHIRCNRNGRSLSSFGGSQNVPIPRGCLINDNLILQTREFQCDLCASFGPRTLSRGLHQPMTRCRLSGFSKVPSSVYAFTRLPRWQRHAPKVCI